MPPRAVCSRRSSSGRSLPGRLSLADESTWAAEIRCLPPTTMNASSPSRLRAASVALVCLEKPRLSAIAGALHLHFIGKVPALQLVSVLTQPEQTHVRRSEVLGSVLPPA